MNYIKRMWNEKPLAFLLFLAFFVRLFSVIFSKGFGMHDDHFLIIEPAKAWADGYDNLWLPRAGEVNQIPPCHSFFYVGLQFLLFAFLKFINITNTQSEMYVVRLLHALLSLVTIYYGYKITLKLSDEKQAKMVGLLLTLFWFMPFLSVRNLVEMVCIPPMVMATWIIIKNQETKKIAPYIGAAVLLGMAFSVRYQTVFFTGGLGLVLLLSKRIKETVILGVAYILVSAGIEGIIDYYIWGKPFVCFEEYIRYNIEYANRYFTQPWYFYMVFLSAFLIPPVSLFLLFGYFKNWKKQMLLFLPSFIFFAFHSYFPNKQERFILPVIPFIIISGYMGWYDFVNKSTFWANHKIALKRIWIFFWTLNCIALAVISVTYTKKNRVEAMTYLSHKHDLKHIAVEDTNNDDFMMPPVAYLQKWGHVYGISKSKPLSTFYEQYKAAKVDNKPNYIVFFQQENIEQRVADFKKYFPTLTYETTIEPSYIDQLVHWLNPVNKNQTTYIYKIE